MRIILDEYDALRVEEQIGERWLTLSDLTDQIIGRVVSNPSLIMLNRDVLEVINDIRYGLDKEPEQLEVVIPDNSLAGLLDTMTLNSFSDIIYVTFNEILTRAAKSGPSETARAENDTNISEHDSGSINEEERDESK